MANDQSPTVAVVWKTPNATDDSGHHPNVSCNRISGTDFIVGKTTVKCKAVDRSGNSATCRFEIMVTGKTIVALKGKNNNPI